MKLFFCYLKSRLGYLLMLCVFTLVFAGVFTLYELPAEAVGYAALLCAVLGILALAFDFAHFRRRHRALQTLQKSRLPAVDTLPAPRDLIDADYAVLLSSLQTANLSAHDKTENDLRDMTDYFTLWAHQIKTPIAALRLLLQERPELQNGTLLAELFKIEQYVEMVLHYIRSGSTSKDYVLKSYPLEDIVTKAARKYAPLFISRKIRLELEPTDCTVLTDEKWLCFVIEQLLSNAVKYGKSVVRIYVRDTATLVIEDDGIGIAPEDLPRIFEKGYTGFNGRSDHRATGLGLYLCKQILDNLHHTVSVQSTLDKGTRVLLDLHTDTLQVE